MTESNVPYIRGTRKFAVLVTNIGLFRQSFDALCGSERMQSVQVRIRAQLQIQEDSVAVSINGLQVGALSRQDARAFNRLVRYGALSVHDMFECAALIFGGWSTEAGKKDYGVRLDLDLED